MREDPWRTRVYNGSAHDRVHTVVASRTVVENGTLPGVDLAELCRRGQELFELMVRGYTERDRARRPTGVLFPPTARACG